MDEITYVQTCLKLIEQKLGWPDRSTWVYDDFRRLQELILESSGTSLSVHTLERLFGKLKTHKNYNPQKETKKALAVFLGYENWKQFKAENLCVAEHSENDTHTVTRETSALPFRDESIKGRSGIKHFFNKRIILSLVIGVIAITIFLIINFYNHAEEITSEVNFSSSNVFGIRPHTVKFTFDLTSIKANDISIDFGTGKPMHNIPKKQTNLYKTYLRPGIYTVQLKGDGELIATKSVFIAMKGWKGYTYTTYEDVETQKSIPDSLFSGTGQLYAPPRMLQDLVEPNMHFFVEYLKVGDFKVDGDNMTFETRFKNNHRFNYQICFDMWFKLIGTDGILKMHFLKSGCAGFVQMVFGENILNGHKQDLSVFTREFHDWRRAKMVVKDKQVNIYFEDDLIYTTSYTQSVGKVLGISITSKGTGQTDYVKLYNSKNELVYTDNL